MKNKACAEDKKKNLSGVMRDIWKTKKKQKKKH